MRIAQPDYIHLFKSFPLLPLESEQDAADAIRVRDWLDTRTQLSKGALDYKAVLEMTILDYDVRKLDEPDLPSAADLGGVLHEDFPPGGVRDGAHACTDDDGGEHDHEEDADDVIVTVPSPDDDPDPEERDASEKDGLSEVFAEAIPAKKGRKRV